MSAEWYKRALVRAWCEDITAAPFVPSINQSDRPLPTTPTWFTIEWQADAVEPAAYCGITEETGLVGIVTGGEPNAGDFTVALANDRIVADLLARIDPEGAFTFERAGATTEHSAGSADRWYRLFTPLEYRLITGPGPITGNWITAGSPAAESIETADGIIAGTPPEPSLAAIYAGGPSYPAAIS